MARGNPNPSPATRFTSSGNPCGKSSAHRFAEVRAGEIAAKIREAALIELQSKIDSGEMTALQAINSEYLKLYKDSEDRAHGTPKQTVEQSGPDGNPIEVRDASFAKFVALLGKLGAVAATGVDPAAGMAGDGAEGPADT